MATTANIQTDGNTAVQHTNKIMEDGTMNHENNDINTVSRFSNAFRMGSISKLVAAAALGLALARGMAVPNDRPSQKSANLLDEVRRVSTEYIWAPLSRHFIT